MSVSSAQGRATVQVQRTIAPGRYLNGPTSPGGEAFDVSTGEVSILAQYREAIGAAKHAIYIENQALEVSEIVVDLHQALERGVKVVAVVPAEPNAAIQRAELRPERAALNASGRKLLRFPNFTLAGLASRTSAGERAPVYVHAKLMIVDDEWATIGSGNLHANSLFHSTEMNVSFMDAETVRAMRVQLFGEHMAEDTSHLGIAEALEALSLKARQNREGSSQEYKSLIMELEPASVGW